MSYVVDRFTYRKEYIIACSGAKDLVRMKLDPEKIYNLFSNKNMKN